MRALLDDPPLLQHHDVVGIRHRRQPVADDDRGASTSRRTQVGEDPGLGAGVHGGQRIVEQQQRRVGEQRARDRDPLALAARQRDAAFADARFVAMRKALDVGVQFGQSRGLSISARVASARASAMLAAIDAENRNGSCGTHAI